MKISLAFVICTWLVTPAAAQVAIEHQPELPAWYDAAVAARKAAHLDEAALLALAPGKVDIKALADDLAKLDWLQVGAYSYADKGGNAAYRDTEICGFQLVRYLPDGGELHFAYAAKCTDKQHGKVEHTNFQMPPPASVAVVEIAGEPYLQMTSSGGKEVHRVVSYADHVLVVDTSYDGKPHSKRVTFREIRAGIARGFTWDPPPPATKKH